MSKNHDKAWEKIDKIADENGGHYVKRTVPGEVDTSDVSDLIQKKKKKCNSDKKKAY